MARTQTPDRIEREQIDGEDVKISVYFDDPEHHTCIEIEREERWVFGIDSDAVATLLTTTTVGEDLLADPDIPEWLVDSLYGLGIEAIEHA